MADELFQIFFFLQWISPSVVLARYSLRALHKKKMRHLIGSCIIDFNARGKCGNTWEWNVRRQWENVLCVSTYKLTAWLGRCMTSNNNPALFPIHFCLYITLVLGVCISLNECSTSRQNSTISICNLWKNKIKFDLLRLFYWLTQEVAPLFENVECNKWSKIYYWSEGTRASNSLWNYYFCHDSFLYRAFASAIFHVTRHLAAGTTN